MGSYRGKVTDDVIGFKPSQPDRTEYGSDVYDSLKKSNKKGFSKLKMRLKTLMDNDVFVENLLYFNDEKFIPINYNTEFISNSHFEINLVANDYKNLWENIKLKNEKHIFDFEFSNIYLAFGFIKHHDYFMPFCFIPLEYVEIDSEISFYRNENLNIQFNYYIIDELYDIEFPMFNGDLIEYINEISEINKIQFIKEAYIGNFNLNVVNFCNDLDTHWDNSTEKINLFFRNNYNYKLSEVINFNNKLASKWPDLDFKLNTLNLDNVHVLIKNLLDDGKNILFVSNKFERDLIIKALFLSNLDNLILDYSMLYEEDFFELILDEYPINNEDIKDFSKLNEELIELEECLEALDTKYSQLALLPHDIKRFRDKYYSKIKDIPHDFPIKNAKTYKSNYINKLKTQLINLIENSVSNDIERYLTDDFYNSRDYDIFKKIIYSFENNLNNFIKINKQVNEVYGIKKFEDLTEIRFLDNLSALNNSCKFIDEIDRHDLNNLLKLKLNSEDVKENNDEYSNGILDKYQIDEDNIEAIENHIKYSELIELEIFNDETLIKNNLSVIIDDLKIVSQINAYLFKQLDYIRKFYEKFKCFETPKELADSKKCISDMKNLIIIFKRDFNILEKYNQSSHENASDLNIKNYFDLWRSGKIKKEFISDIFLYNLYNSILNSFLEEFEFIDEEHIASSYYDDKYDEVYLKIKEIESNQFKQSIYLKLKELNQINNVKKQKDDWALKISNGELISINDALTNYKDYIFSNKRIFMINFELIPLILNQTFENFFDYALISINDNIDEMCNLSILLRTKNKLITLGKGE